MITECVQFGIEVGVVPVGQGYRCAKVVDDYGFGNAAKMVKRILQTTDKILGALMKNRFGLTFSGMR